MSLRCQDLPSPVHALKPLPLALPPASIPAIFGDKANIVGCARAWRTFLILGATSASPPFAADIDVKPPAEFIRKRTDIPL
ncbi:Os06g0366800 [Oryza sativa Japonica Group]|uniref:Os06g0366800 protein n=1 Tax=Oryza sativa subsp. japonica TaxID=39947 RepID=Q0DC99_ORYSJ|nr:Os06g0366800 [Oryza sativa Japonica Group]|eukprot:NP_001057610.2 Os06g0366800 [Oryza sativa Japonica Group]